VALHSTELFTVHPEG